MANRLTQLLPEPQNPAPSMAIRAMKKFRRPPLWLVGVFLISVVASWIPLAAIADSRVRKSKKPAVHLFLDMDIQPKYGAQDPSPVFADGRVMRPVIPFTVARGRSALDGETAQPSGEAFERGFVLTGGTPDSPQVQFLDRFPEALTIDQALLARGKRQYEIYCYVCHGYDGYGNGRVHQWTQTRGQQPRWVQPSSLHTAAIIDRPDGHLYNTINNGIRNMSGYGSQIAPHDRWAIVAYIRALQISQNAPIDALDAQERSELRADTDTDANADASTDPRLAIGN